jgi:tetratricopeptide (TPR) repeat protein
LNLSVGEPKIDILVAKIYLAAGQIERAAEKALDALDMSQAIPEAHFVLGTCLAWMQQPADALLCLDMAIKLQPDHVEAQRFTKILKGEEIYDEFDSILDRCNAFIPYGSNAFKEMYHKQ